MSEMEKKVGCSGVLMRRYEMGRLLGQGSFAKVYYARSLATGKGVAIKVIDKEKVLRVGMIDQIKREISVMRLVRHPNVVQLYEVMASKTKIYFAMEYVRGGELFNKIARGRLKEDVARRYFQQLISSVDFCHSRGVYHRDLKPENLLVDETGDLKITDFGLSALADSRRQDGLLHTTCGTPAYVAPEVITKRGYDGSKADIWSCGVILFVLLAGFLPFQDSNLMEMYRRISKADFRCPNWFPSEARKLISRLLDPNPSTRITTPMILESPWFKKGFKPVVAPHDATDVPTDVDAVFSSTASDGKPTSLNAFDIISLSQGFNLSGLFHGCGQRAAVESRFTTQKPVAAIVSKLEEIAETGSFSLKKKDGKLNLQGRKEGRKGQLGIDAEIFEVTPSFHVVEVKKSAGDTLEYQQFCDQGLKPSLQDIVWAWQQGGQVEHQNFSGEFSLAGATSGTSPPITATSA